LHRHDDSLSGCMRSHMPLPSPSSLLPRWTALFERRKEYGIAVWMSRHPDLNAAVEEVLQSLRGPVSRNAVDAVVVALCDEDSGVAFEHYRCGVSVATGEEVAATYSDMDAQYGAALLRVQALGVTMPPVPVGTSFTMLVEAREGGEGGAGLSGPSDRDAYAALTGESERVGRWGGGGGFLLQACPSSPAPPPRRGAVQVATVGTWSRTCQAGCQRATARVGAAAWGAWREHRRASGCGWMQATLRCQP
jgi:hypothetical protein